MFINVGITLARKVLNTNLCWNCDGSKRAMLVAPIAPLPVEVRPLLEPPGPGGGGEGF